MDTLCSKQIIIKGESMQLKPFASAQQNQNGTIAGSFHNVLERGKGFEMVAISWHKLYGEGNSRTIIKPSPFGGYKRALLVCWLFQLQNCFHLQKYMNILFALAEQSGDNNNPTSSDSALHHYRKILENIYLTQQVFNLHLHFLYANEPSSRL